MTTATATRPAPATTSAPVKPARTIGWVVDHGGDTGVIRITEGEQVDLYAIAPIPVDRGTCYRLAKLVDGHVENTYRVVCDGRRSSCQCKGWLRWRKCRHVSGLAKMEAEGKLGPAF